MKTAIHVRPMAHTRRHALIGIAGLALASCGGGGSGDTDNGQPSPRKLELALAQTDAWPWDEIKATIKGPAGAAIDTGSTELMADLGQGVIANIPFKAISRSEIAFTAPAGVFQGGNLSIGSGVAKFFARLKSNSSETQSSDVVDLNIKLPDMPNFKAGEIAKAYIKANRGLLLGSMGRYDFLGTQVKSIKSEKLLELKKSINRQVDALNEMIMKIEEVQAGSVVEVGKVGEVKLIISNESLISLDRYVFSLLRIDLPLQKKKINSGVKNEVSELFDISQLTRGIAENLRDMTERNRGAITTGLSVAAGGVALIAGLPIATAAAAAGGLAAIAWFSSVTAGSGISMALEAGTSAILDGKAKLEDFKGTGEYVFNAYLEQAKGYAQERILSEMLGDPWASMVDTGINLAATAKDFIDEDISQALRSGEMPSEGYPNTAPPSNEPGTENPGPDSDRYTLVVSVVADGMEASPISIPNVAKPSSQAEFCSWVTAPGGTVSLSEITDFAMMGSATFKDCSFNGSVGRVTATITVTSPSPVTMQYVVTYTFR